jgi:chromosome segregation ATPase
MKKISLIIVAGFLFFSALAFGQEVYKWVDEKGVVHFTDDINLVPEKYRSGAKKIGSSEETGEIKGDGESSPKRKEDPYKDRLGRGEDYWKGLMEDWKKKLKELQDHMEFLRNKYNGLTEKYNDSKSTVERANLRKDRDLVKNEMDQNRAQIEEAKNMIEKKIPEEAELYKAKPEWLK